MGCCSHFDSMKKFTRAMVTATANDSQDLFSTVGFSSTVTSAGRLSSSSGAIEEVERLVYSGGGTNHAVAITACQQSFADFNEPDRENIILLITDGVATLPGGDPMQSAGIAADEAKKVGIHIVPVSVGFKDQVQLDYLARLSSHGKVSDVGDFEELSSLVVDLVPRVACVSSAPSSTPSSKPSGSPSVSPSSMPSGTPSSSPSAPPSALPSNSPSGSPSAPPSSWPSRSPSGGPSASPSASPSGSPSTAPTNLPSGSPSTAPTALPSSSPSRSPSTAPSSSPSNLPSGSPSGSPSAAPSGSPSRSPSAAPSTSPSGAPSAFPSGLPSRSPSVAPSASTFPSSSPSRTSSGFPSDAPIAEPSNSPIVSPSATPSTTPSTLPSYSPSSPPSSMAPTEAPTKSPTFFPTHVPSLNPSLSPTQSPTTPRILSCGIASDCAGYRGCTDTNTNCKCKKSKCRRKWWDCKTSTRGQELWPCSIRKMCTSEGNQLWGTCTFLSDSPSRSPSNTMSNSPSATPNTQKPTATPIIAPTRVPTDAPTTSFCSVPSDCNNYRDCNGAHVECMCEVGTCKRKWIDCLMTQEKRWPCVPHQECISHSDKAAWGICSYVSDPPSRSPSFSPSVYHH